MDNAQMTSQIAQINTVGGIEKLNRTVESLLAAFGNLQAQSATQLPGRSVLVEAEALTLRDGLATGGVELDGAADSVTVEILDGSGVVVQTLALGKSPAGVRSFTWDGQQADGQASVDGDWRMRVAATAGGQPVAARTLGAALVQSVANGTASPQLDLGSAGVRPWSAIKSFL
jgi:flagellar basal-body rod modification protein FlgD